MCTWKEGGTAARVSEIVYNIESEVNLSNSGSSVRKAGWRSRGSCSAVWYYTPYVESTDSQTCCTMSISPGCKKPFWQFQYRNPRKRWTLAFGLVPGCIFVTISALMCGNYATYR